MTERRLARSTGRLCRSPVTRRPLAPWPPAMARQRPAAGSRSVEATSRPENGRALSATVRRPDTIRAPRITPTASCRAHVDALQRAQRPGTGPPPFARRSSPPPPADSSVTTSRRRPHRGDLARPAPPPDRIWARHRRKARDRPRVLSSASGVHNSWANERRPALGHQAVSRRTASARQAPPTGRPQPGRGAAIRHRRRRYRRPEQYPAARRSRAPSRRGNGLGLDALAGRRAGPPMRQPDDRADDDRGARIVAIAATMLRRSDLVQRQPPQPGQRGLAAAESSSDSGSPGRRARRTPAARSGSTSAALGHLEDPASGRPSICPRIQAGAGCWGTGHRAAIWPRC